MLNYIVKVALSLSFFFCVQALETIWIEISQAKKSNGVITVILKEYFPGLVNYKGRVEPPWTWEHYAAAPDAPDEYGVEYNSCLERVEETFWVIFAIYVPHPIILMFIDLFYLLLCIAS